MNVKQVKQELPTIMVRYNGEKWWARVTGRLNPFASVSPYQRVSGDNRPIMGPVIQFSWESVAAAASGKVLDCEQG